MKNWSFPLFLVVAMIVLVVLYTYVEYHKESPRANVDGLLLKCSDLLSMGGMSLKDCSLKDKSHVVCCENNNKLVECDKKNFNRGELVVVRLNLTRMNEPHLPYLYSYCFNTDLIDFFDTLQKCEHDVVNSNKKGCFIVNRQHPIRELTYWGLTPNKERFKILEYNVTVFGLTNTTLRLWGVLNE